MQWVRREELFPVAQALGVTERQLKRWSDEHLLQRTKVHLGRGRGTRSEYSPDSAARLQFIVEMLPAHRDFNELRLLIWLHGHDMQPAALRKSLARLMPTLTVPAGRGIIFERLLVAVRRWSALGRTPVGRIAKRRVKSEDARTEALAALLTAASGGEISFRSDMLEADFSEPSLGIAAEDLIGATPGRTIRLGNAGPWLNGAPGADLDKAVEMGVFNLRNLKRTLAKASLDELNIARSDLRLLSDTGGSLPTVEKTLDLNANALGFGALTALSNSGPGTLAVALGGLVILRQQLPEQCTLLFDACRNLMPTVRSAAPDVRQ